MNRALASALALSAVLATAGSALAQPAYGPNAVQYYPSYAAPPPPLMAVPVGPPVVLYPPPAYDDTHSSGGAARAYSYWGAQKSN